MPQVQVIPLAMGQIGFLRHDSPLKLNILEKYHKYLTIRPDPAIMPLTNIKTPEMAYFQELTNVATRNQESSCEY